MGHYITSCPIVPDPELNLTEMPMAFDSAVKAGLKLLREAGIDDKVNVDLRKLTGEQQCWLAAYIRMSQFNGNPLFYVNTQTPGIIDAANIPQDVTVEDVFLDSFLHEYGHIIEEWAGQENPEMKRVIYGPFADEEDFAEYMIDYFRYKTDVGSNRRRAAEIAVNMFVADVFI